MARPSTFAATRNAVALGQPGIISRANVTTVTGRLTSLFGYPTGGSVPTAGVVPPSPRPCTNTTQGALGFASSEDGMILSLTCTSTLAGGLVFYDRLCDAPVSLTASGAQAINTPALTRSTSGEFVFAFIENFATLATSTAQVLTLAGTDSAGNATSATISVPVNGFSTTVGRPYFAVFPAGVRGLRTITTATWSSPPTATPTDAALVLGKLVGTSTAQIVDTQLVPTDRYRTPMNIDGGACLAMMHVGGAGTGTLLCEGWWL